MYIKPAFIFTALFLFLFIINVSAYQVTFVGKDNGGTVKQNRPPSLYWDQSCIINTTLKNSGGAAGSFYIINQYLNPYNDVIATSTKTYSSNTTCSIVNVAPLTSTAANGYYYEVGSNSTTTASTFNTWIINNYTCDNDNDWFSYYSDFTIKDSFGYYPASYGYDVIKSCTTNLSLASNLPIIISDYLDKKYYPVINGDCPTALLYTDANYDLKGYQNCGGATGEAYLNYWVLIPFRTSEFGLINISITDFEFNLDATTGCTPRANSDIAAYIYDRYTNSTTLLTNSYPYSTTNYLLVQNRDYWLFIGGQGHESHTSPYDCEISFNHSTYELDIYDYQPDWSCGEWSECDNNKKTRLCIDNNGIADPKIEESSCLDIYSAFFSYNLGFEESYNQNTYFCGKTWSLFACNDILNNITALYPVNWTTSASIDFFDFARQNYMTITSEHKSIGSRSLKMWYIPPKLSEPITDLSNSSLTSCGNRTIGSAPAVSTPFNETLFLSTNITFPNPNVDITFDVKQCDNQVLQFDYTGDFLGVNCGIMCYAENCNSTPKSDFGIRLMDADTNEIIYDFYGNASAEWENYLVDLSNAGILTNHNYTFAIAVNPINLYSPYGHCAYFDNVNANYRSEDIECISYCDGLTYYYARQTGNSCTFKVTELSPDCTTDETIKDAIRNKETFDSDGVRCVYDEKNANWDCFDIPINQTTTETEAPETLENWIYLFFSADVLLTMILFGISLVITFKKPDAWFITAFMFLMVIFVLSVKVVISPFIAWGELIIGIAFLGYSVSRVMNK